MLDTTSIQLFYSHGPKTTEFYSAVTRIFISSDWGKIWEYIGSLQNQFWSNLFKIYGFIPFNGGNKNFTIRYDQKAEHYWTLTKIVLSEYQRMKPSGIGNVLALCSASDLETWETNKIVFATFDLKNLNK